MTISRKVKLSAVLLVALTQFAFAESGYQTINGTRVFTVIDRSRGVATFSNDCGSQTLTQRELQQGAIPSEIIPCPRPGSEATSSTQGSDDEEISPPVASSTDESPPVAENALLLGEGRGQFGAIAVGSGWWGSGSGSTQEMANDAAIKWCEKNGSDCKIVKRFGRGDCGALAADTKSDAMGWAPTMQQAYENCAKRTSSGACTVRLFHCTIASNNPADADSSKNNNDPITRLPSCIEIREWRNTAGQKQYIIRNTCNVTVTFDMDDCHLDQYGQGVCTSITTSVAADDSFEGYGTPRARNFR